jgi:hypothetical protein
MSAFDVNGRSRRLDFAARVGHRFASDHEPRDIRDLIALTGINERQVRYLIADTRMCGGRRRMRSRSDEEVSPVRTHIAFCDLRQKLDRVGQPLVFDIDFQQACQPCRAIREHSQSRPSVLLI